MSHKAKKLKICLIPLFILIAVLVSFLGWQLQAQLPPAKKTVFPQATSSDGGAGGGVTPPMPGGAPPPPGGTRAPGAAPAAGGTPAAEPSEPTYSLKTVVPSGITVKRIKNWDGTVTEMLRFKYQCSSGNKITVHLPAAYKSEKLTKAGWNTLFQVFCMDYEAQLDAWEKNSGEMSRKMAEAMGMLGQFMGQLANELQRQFPGNAGSPAGSEDFSDDGTSSGGTLIPPVLPGLY